MGVYARFKRGPEGFRALVELLESTPKQRRDRMIEVGMQEDPDFTMRALRYLMTFEDVLQLSDLELAELLAKSAPRYVAYAIRNHPRETHERFLRNCQTKALGLLREHLEEDNVGLAAIATAQLKLIEITRSLERAGYVKIKKIP